MRSITKRALIAIVAVFAIAALGTSSASAALPEFSPAGAAEKPIKFTFKGGKVRLGEAGVERVECKATAGEGSITSAKALTAKFKFKECGTLPFAGDNCKSTGAGTGEVVTPELKSTLAYISKATKEVGIVVNSEGTNPPFAVFECSLNKYGLQNGVIAAITPINTKSKALALSLKWTEHNQTNTPSQYENELGEKITRTLIGNLLGNYPNALGPSGMNNESAMENLTQSGAKIEVEVKA
jgi:hypothetical protein